MGECASILNKGHSSNKHKVQDYVDSFSCFRQSLKFPPQDFRKTSPCVKSSLTQSVKYREVIPPNSSGPCQYQRLEPEEWLDKLFALCGCTVHKQIPLISEGANIVAELKRRGEIDDEHYLGWMNGNDETALEIAIKAENKVMVGILLNAGDECAQCDAFLAACRRGSKSILNLLLESGADAYLDINVKTDCILLCAQHGYTCLLKMLHKAGFCLGNVIDKIVSLKSPNARTVPSLWKTQTNGSLLHVAAGNGHHQIIDYLTSQNADIESVDSCGWKPVHFAVQGGIQCLRILLRGGIDIEAADNEGHSPLFLAASFGNFSAVKLLVENGAELDTENDEGVSALVAAASSNQDIIVKYLLDKGATFKGVYPEKLVRYTNSKVLPQLTFKKISPELKQNVNWLTLNMLSQIGHVLPAARISLYLGIDPNIILSEAVQGRHRNVVKLLDELDCLENTTLLALNCSCLKAFQEIIIKYAFPKRLPHSTLLRALQ
jgi:ankyrin repeat protein